MAHSQSALVAGSRRPFADAPTHAVAASNFELLRRYLRHWGEPDQFYRALSERAVSSLDLPLRGRRVLDLGCGRGWDADALTSSGADVVALELSEELLRARRPDEAPQVLADGRRTPFADGTFDGVYCSNVLEHTPDVPGLLDEIGRVTAEGGWAWISWTNWYSPVGGHEIMPFHYLGPDLGTRAYRRVVGEPRQNVVGDGLWPVHVGEVLRLVRAHPTLELVDARPRYYPSQRWIISIPGAREVLTWNCAMTLMRRRSPRDRS